MKAPFTEVDPNATSWHHAVAEESMSLVLGSFSDDGQLRYANAGMRRLLKLDVGPFDPAYFRCPSFDTFKGHAPSREPAYNGLVTIHDGSDFGTSILASVFRRVDGIHFLGEYDVKELGAVNDQMHDLNGEVSRLHRESARQTRELQKALRELQESQTERERLQTELMTASRRAGQAEVAVGVLHNVGNTLNSLLVSSALIAETVQAGQLTSLRGVVSILEKHKANLPGFMASSQGESLLPYLQALSGKMLEERERLVDEARGMSGRLTTLAQFIDEHRQYGQQTTVIERVELVCLVENLWPTIVEAHQSSAVEISLGELKASITQTDPFRVRGLLQELVTASVTLASSASEAKHVEVTVYGEPSPRMRITIAGLFLTENQCQALIRPVLEPNAMINLHHAANVATELKAKLNVAAEPSVGTTIVIHFPSVGDDLQQPAMRISEQSEMKNAISSRNGTSIDQ